MKTQERRMIPPREGWEPQTWYLVDVEYFSTNPRHRSLFFSGFLNADDNGPGGYSGLVGTGGYAENHNSPNAWREVHYFRVVRRLFAEKELTSKEPVVLEKDTRAALLKVADYFSVLEGVETALWACGCGHWNGPNLAVCAACGRDPRGVHP